MIDVGENTDKLVRTIFDQVSEDSLSERQLIMISYLCEAYHMENENERIAGTRFMKKGGRLYNGDLVSTIDNLEHIDSKPSDKGSSETLFAYENRFGVQGELLSNNRYHSVRIAIQQLGSTERKSLQSEVEDSEQFSIADSGDYLLNDSIRSMDGYQSYAVVGVVLTFLFPFLTIVGVVELLRHLFTRARADSWYDKSLSAGIMRGTELAAFTTIVLLSVYLPLVYVSSLLG